MAKFILNNANFTIGIVPLVTNCPKFQNLDLLPYQVESRVDPASFEVFISALEGKSPVITPANMNDLFLLSTEFGFANLLSRVSDFIAEHSGVDDETWKRVRDIEDDNLEQNRIIGFLQKDVSDLLNCVHGLLEDNAQLKQPLCLLQKEISELRSLNSRLSEENQALFETNRVQERENQQLRADQARLNNAIKEILQELASTRKAITELQQQHCELRSELEHEKAKAKGESPSVQKMPANVLQRGVSGLLVSLKPRRSPSQSPSGLTSIVAYKEPLEPKGLFATERKKVKYKEEKEKAALSGIISVLARKCGGNVHNMGVIEITASSVYDDNPKYAAWMTADLGTYSFFQSGNKPEQWICFDFKTLRIELTHYTIMTTYSGHLKNWVIEGSDGGVTWTEIDRRENNNDLNAELAIKTFAVAGTESFGMIRLRQTGPNHSNSNLLRLSIFEVFGTVAGLPDDVIKLRFPMAPEFPLGWVLLNGIMAYLAAKCGGNVHDKGVVEITASSVGRGAPRDVADIESDDNLETWNKPGQWICFDFKTLRIELTHYAIRTVELERNGEHMKNWAIEGSEDGVLWTELDRQENNEDLNGKSAEKAFAVSEHGRFGKIRLRQVGLNHSRNYVLTLQAFELFGSLALVR
jgi:FtsZ-binding cell division protein ZapB